MVLCVNRVLMVDLLLLLLLASEVVVMIVFRVMGAGAVCRELLFAYRLVIRINKKTASA
uniref:Uncharacterized protein n=1 Tax=Octopus bimaculoides TaxID=37653 RepID=A0A0L8GPF1_OCTBM